MVDRVKVYDCVILQETDSGMRRMAFKIIKTKILNAELSDNYRYYY